MLSILHIKEMVKDRRTPLKYTNNIVEDLIWIPLMLICDGLLVVGVLSIIDMFKNI